MVLNNDNDDRRLFENCQLQAKRVCLFVKVLQHWFSRQFNVIQGMQTGGKIEGKNN